MISILIKNFKIFSYNTYSNVIHACFKIYIKTLYK